MNNPSNTSNYTRGPLRIGKTLAGNLTLWAPSDPRFSISITVHRGPVAYEDTRRLAACWNAFDGEEFTTERIESGDFNASSLVDQAFRASEANVATTAKLLKVTSQRDELLEILRDIRGRSCISGETSLIECIDEVIRKQINEGVENE